MQLKFNLYGAIITNKAGTKEKGRQTGASPAVISRLCLDLGCSDLPPLFNQKFIFMQPKIDDQDGHNIIMAPEQIINEFLQTADIDIHIENLHDYFICYVLNYGGSTGKWNESMVSTYEAIRDLFFSIRQLTLNY